MRLLDSNDHATESFKKEGTEDLKHIIKTLNGEARKK